MKYALFFLVLISCASKNPDWDNGAQKQQNYSDEQAQEQVDTTRNQFTTPGKAGVNTNQPF